MLKDYFGILIFGIATYIIILLKALLQGNTLKSILYFYPNPATFVTKDLSILESKYSVKKFLFAQTKPLETMTSFIEQALCLLWNIRIGTAVIQFGGYHSFLPCLWGLLFKKRTVLILAGTDCASFPEINYGNYRKKLLGWMTKKSIEWAAIVVPVHKALIDYEYTYYNAVHARQGFRNYTGNLRGKLEVAEYGFEINHEPTFTNRSLGFVTIAGFNRDNIYYLKGLDLMCKVAPHYPDLPFFIVGASPKYLNYSVPSNVSIMPFVSEAEKNRILSSYTFYLQLSLSEGFPNALCEAMQNGMIPIVSKVSSMPDLVSPAGFVLDKKDEGALKNLIDVVLKMDLEELSKKNASKINTAYTPQRRKERLLEILEMTN